ncbi:diaminopimelate epimerase [Pseudomonas syringae]|uniref:diaminopimelate epimerase n=1 Tax=Pseudomonas syringae TaxID=317 RepID=UPI003F83E13B
MIIIQFHKYHVSGNDFIIIEESVAPSHVCRSELAKFLCDRKFGVGGDQLILVLGEQDCALNIEIWNPDGTLSPFCGNACLATASFWSGMRSRTIDLKLLVGGASYELTFSDDQWNVQLPNPVDEYALEGDKLVSYRQHFIRNGTVHRVVIVDSDAEIDFMAKGQSLSSLPDTPEQVNVMFVHSVSNDCFTLIPWERGGTGLSMACASGASAAAWVLYADGEIENEVVVNCPGGVIPVCINDKGIKVGGSPVLICSGQANYSR